MEHLKNNVGRFHEDYPDYQIWVVSSNQFLIDAGDMLTLNHAFADRMGGYH